MSNVPAEIAWLEYQIAHAEKKIEQYREAIATLRKHGDRRDRLRVVSIMQEEPVEEKPCA